MTLSARTSAAYCATLMALVALLSGCQTQDDEGAPSVPLTGYVDTLTGTAGAAQDAADAAARQQEATDRESNDLLGTE